MTLLLNEEEEEMNIFFGQNEVEFFVSKKQSPDDIDQFAFDPNQTIALNPNLTILNQLYLGQSNPIDFFESE